MIPRTWPVPLNRSATLKKGTLFRLIVVKVQYQTDFVYKNPCIARSSGKRHVGIVRVMEEKQLFGQRVKRLRARLGLTQDQLAERIHISPKYLSNIERGKENPTLDTLLRMAKSLKVEPWEMFFVELESLNHQALKKKVSQLLEETNEEKLRLIVQLLQAVLHATKN